MEKICSFKNPFLDLEALCTSRAESRASAWLPRSRGSSMQLCVTTSCLERTLTAASIKLCLTLVPSVQILM